MYLEELLPEFRKGAKIRRKCWKKNEFIYMENDTLFNEENLELDGTEMDIFDIFMTDDWELYQEPIDWDYIINNKCLCYLWDDEKETPQIRILKKIVDECSHPYLSIGNYQYRHCRPVRRDEVTFYEDKEND